MSQPPSYAASPATNPDSRPLPEGWITQFNKEYVAFLLAAMFVIAATSTSTLSQLQRLVFNPQRPGVQRGDLTRLIAYLGSM